MTDTERPLCRLCGKPNGESCDMDPCPPNFNGPSYMHPECARSVTRELAAKRTADRKRLEAAAPDLLAACEMLVTGCGVNDSLPPWVIKAHGMALAAIRKAKGGAA